MDKKVLLRHIMGKASRSERLQVISWIEESQENMETYAAMKAEYVFSGLPNAVVPEKRRIFPIIVRVAAVLSIPLLAAGIYLYITRNNAFDRYADASRQVEVLQKQNPGTITYVANPGIKSTVILPDSSVVRLNGDSKLVVPNVFDPDIRELSLYGEGYFEVRHNENWPMHIHTAKGVTVKVLGTTFDLAAYEEDASVKLTLIEGKVVMHEDRTKSEHVIRPNQEITIADRTENTLVKAPVPEIKRADVQKNTAWKDGQLIFDNTPMPEIVKQLERWYGVNVHIVDEKILSYHLTATFTTESITRVLELIKFSSLVDYKIDGAEVYIRSRV